MKIEINITEEEYQILENDLLDVKQWIVDAVKGKINKCKKRIIKHIIVNENLEQLQTFDKNPIKAYLKDPKYKSRKERNKVEQKIHEETILKENT